MNHDIDKKISEALRSSFPEVDLGPEPGLTEELVTAFRGRNKFTNVMALFWSLVGFGAFCWSGVNFFEAEMVKDQLLWGGICLYSTLFIAFMKVWFWMEMHSNRVLREIKLIELILCSRSD